MANIGGAISGGLGGVGTGALLGSLGGPIGTGIGAGVGGLAGLLSGLLSGGGQPPAQLQDQGRDPRILQVQKFNPEQQAALSQILQQALGGLQEPSAGFAPIAQQARTQFEQQTVPSLAERFTGLDGQRSSAFSQTLGQAGAGLEQALAGQQAQFGQQQQQLLQQLLGLGLTSPFETGFQKQAPSFLENLLPLLISGGLRAGGKLGGAYLQSKYGQGLSQPGKA